MDDPTQRTPPDAERQPPRRARRAWVLPTILGSLILVGVLAAAAVIAGPDLGRRAATSAPDSAAGDGASLDALFELTANDQPLRHGHRGHGPLQLREGEKVLAGSVNSVADGKLVVRKDNGAEVTVPTNGNTRVYGARDKAPRNKELSDLQAGERVIVRVGSDGVAAGVLTVRAHAAGTVTALDGDRATVVQTGGLSTVLDLSAVTERPAVGTVVVAVGTATDDGATLKVEQIRELPTMS
jgi:hypothetical protein